MRPFQEIAVTTLGVALDAPAAAIGSGFSPSIPGSPSAMVFPPLSLDLGMLLISIGLVNIWNARRS
ncbi:MAG: hypothetical protein ACRC1L_02790 [Prochlorococcaceae cyanobacterium]